jgi:hypothetical protein
MNADNWRKPDLTPSHRATKWRVHSGCVLLETTNGTNHPNEQGKPSRSNSYHYLFKSCFPAKIFAGTQHKLLGVKELCFAPRRQDRQGKRIEPQETKEDEKRERPCGPVLPLGLFFRLFSFLSAIGVLVAAGGRAGSLVLFVVQKHFGSGRRPGWVYPRFQK